MGIAKQHLVLAAAGLAVISGASYVLAQPTPSTDEVALTQASSPERDGRPHAGGFPRALRGEAVVPSREDAGQFETVKFDRGILERVDGTTLVIKEDDGTVVNIPTSDDTRFGRDGERAELSDLKAGDHVFAFRLKDGDSFVTKGVRALSPEKYKEFEDRRGEKRESHGKRPRGKQSS